MKKILITGATGFIGKQLIDFLLKNTNHKIIATCRSEEEVLGIDWKNQVEFKVFDINSKITNNLYEFFDKPDLMIHLAWEGLPNYKEMFHLEKNLFLHYFFIKNMIENGLKDLIVTGTCFEYGLVNGCLTEDMQTNPNTPYALAKDSLRKFIFELQKTNNFNIKWLRLFYLYSKNKNYRSIFAQLDAALANGDKVFNMSKGEQIRDYISVEELIEKIAKISLQNDVNGIINCCSGKPISLRCMIEDYLKIRGKKIELNLGYYAYLDYEPFAFWGDNIKMNKCLEGVINV